MSSLPLEVSLDIESLCFHLFSVGSNMYVHDFVLQRKKKRRKFQISTINVNLKSIFIFLTCEVQILFVMLSDTSCWIFYKNMSHMIWKSQNETKSLGDGSQMKYTSYFIISFFQYIIKTVLQVKYEFWLKFCSCHAD